MTIPEENPFVVNDLFPSWFANAIQRFLSGAAPAFQLSKEDATHVRVVAGTDVNAAMISINGKWRWIEATANRAHPGGASGTWDIYAVAANNKIESGGVDATNRAFALRIVESGKTPPIEAGVVDVFRKVGSLQWSGTEITRVDQTVPLMATHAHRHAVGEPDAIAPSDIGAAPLASPGLSGTPTAPTAAPLTNSTRIATTAYADLATAVEKTRAEAAESALQKLPSDILQAGVVERSEIGAGDWRIGGVTINSGTGVLSASSATGGPHTAWIEVGGVLIRSVTATALFKNLAPPSLPASGKYMTVGVHLVPPAAPNGEATFGTVSGVEKTTEAEALASGVPALVAERLRLCDVTILNTAGVYSVIIVKDRRPWARGAFALITHEATEALNNAAFTVMTSLNGRIEVGTGELVRLTLAGEVESTVAANEILLRMSSTGATAATNPIWRATLGSGVSSSFFQQAFYTNVHGAIAGSRLFRPEYKTSAGSANFKGMTLLIEELRIPGNNGIV